MSARCLRPRWLATLLASAALAAPAAAEPPPEGTCPALYGAARRRPRRGRRADAAFPRARPSPTIRCSRCATCSPTRSGSSATPSSTTACASRSAPAIAAIRRPTSTRRRPSSSPARRSSTPTGTCTATSRACPSRRRRSIRRRPTRPCAGPGTSRSATAARARRGSSGWSTSRARMGGVMTYEGTFFFLQSRERADLAASSYAIPGADESLWISRRPLRRAAGRPLPRLAPDPLARVGDALHERDQTFVYVPTMRKVRRSATPWVDGLFTPRYRVSGDGRRRPESRSAAAPTGRPTRSNPTAAESAQSSEYLRRGFATLSLRPNAYVWRLLGEREVLAPINSSHEGYPTDPGPQLRPERTLDRERSLGRAPGGRDRGAGALPGSVQDADDVRRLPDPAAALSGPARRARPHHRRRHRRPPLQRRRRSAIRSSGRAIKANVFDPVAEVFYVMADDSGWRRESWDVKSIPTDDRVQRRFTSTDFLMRGR